MSTNITTIGSTYNYVAGNQVNNYYLYQVTVPSDSSSPSPFIDAPIDIMSIHFTGRTEELLRIKEMLGATVTPGDTPIRCVIHGIPGIGKSQLALYFAKTAFDQGQYQYVLWISATTVPKFQQGFVKLLYLVNHRDRDHTQQDTRLIAARRWLEECDAKWLLVLDNVTLDVLDFLRQHLPHRNTRGSMIFTTRTEGLASALANSGGQKHQILELRTPNVHDTARLLLLHVTEETDDTLVSKAMDVVKCVGCLPLAVAQAGSFMKETSTDLDKMLDLYHSKHKIEVLNWENALSDYEVKSVTATFSSQFEQLASRSPNANDLLKVLSFLDPESISLDMLLQGAKTIPVVDHHSIFNRIKNMWSGSPNFTSLLALFQSPIDFPDAIAQLQRQSLAQCENAATSPTLRIHDLIQFMVQENVNKGGSGKHWFEFAVKLVAGAFSLVQQPQLPQNWSQCEIFISHFRCLTTKQETYGSRETWTTLMNDNERISDYLTSRGRYAETEHLLRQVLESREQVLGWDKLETWQAQHRIALLYQYQGRHKEALELYTPILAFFEKRLGVEHFDTVATMANIANSYRYEERRPEAEAMYKRVLAACEKHFGPDNHLTLGSLNNLAIMYRSWGRVDEAEEMQLRILAEREKRDGPEHPDTLKSQNNLANIYAEQGKYHKAEEMLDSVIATRKKVLGPEHPDTISAIGNLAQVYEKQGRHDQAEEMYRHVLVTQEKLLGAQHPHTLKSMNNLVFLYKSQGRLGDAQVMQERILDIQEKHLGEPHPHTLMTMSDLSALYVSQGLFNAAEAMHLRMLAVREATLGTRHRMTLSSVYDLATLYESERRYNDAEGMYKRLLDGTEELLPSGHPVIVGITQSLAHIYRAQGRLDEAEALIAQVVSHPPAPSMPTNTSS